MAKVLGINTSRDQVPSERTVVNEALNDLNISGGGLASDGFFKDNAISAGASKATSVSSTGGKLAGPVIETNGDNVFVSALDDTQIGKPTNRGNVQEVKSLTYNTGSYNVAPRA